MNNIDETALVWLCKYSIENPFLLESLINSNEGLKILTIKIFFLSLEKNY